MLDTAAEQADWREVTSTVLGADPAPEPARPEHLDDSHLERPRWVTRVGYLDLLDESKPDRSFSDLLSTSRAEEATTGWTPRGPRCGVVIRPIARNTNARVVLRHAPEHLVRCLPSLVLGLKRRSCSLFRTVHGYGCASPKKSRRSRLRTFGAHVARRSSGARVWPACDDPRETSPSRSSGARKRCPRAIPGLDAGPDRSDTTFATCRRRR